MHLGQATARSGGGVASQRGILVGIGSQGVPPAAGPPHALGTELRLAGENPGAGGEVGGAAEELCAQEGEEDDGAGTAAHFQRAAAAPELGGDVLERDGLIARLGAHELEAALGAKVRNATLPRKIAAVGPTLRRRPRVLLGVCGSVAAVKLPELAMRLSVSVEVRLMLTASGKHFVENVAPSYNPSVWDRWLRMKHMFPVYEDKDEWAGYTDVGTDTVLHIEVGHAAAPRRSAGLHPAVMRLPAADCPWLPICAPFPALCSFASGQTWWWWCRCPPTRLPRSPAASATTCWCGRALGARGCAHADALGADLRAQGVGRGPQAGGALPRDEHGHVGAPGHGEAPGGMPRGLPRDGGGAGGQDAGVRGRGCAIPAACIQGGPDPP